MQWFKKDADVKTIDDFVFKNTGMTVSEFTSVSESPIANLKKAVDFVKEKIDDGDHITIIGDYDADGITAAAILFLAVRRYMIRIGVWDEGRVSVRLPKRLSEGYGLSTSIIDELKDTGTIIAVDNGISAASAVKVAKKKGFSVVVLDHHVSTGILPAADIIVDPNVIAEDGYFTDFCGAGLAYRFSEELEGEPDPVAVSLAAIGTVADVVPLVRDNRIIVQRGLKSLQEGKTTFGIKALMSCLGLTKVTAEDIGYRLAPCLNAPGRLIDDGANLSLSLILAEQESKSTDDTAKTVVDLNNSRKKIVAKHVKLAEKRVDQQTAPLIIVLPNAPEGIVGLVAGKLAEKYHVPSLVLTKGERKGILKGSGRSYGNFNLIEMLLKAKDLFKSLGGHPGAAGFSLPEDMLETLKTRLGAAMADYRRMPIDIGYYDLKVSVDSIENLAKCCDLLEPFGNGNPKPVFYVPNFTIQPVCKIPYRAFGSGRPHICLYRQDCTAICFDLAEKYLAKPSGTVGLYGTIGRNSRANGRVQIVAKDIVT